MGLKINGEVVQLAQGAVQRDDTTYELEIDGRTSVSLLLTNLSQTAPAGRFKFYISADELAFQRLNSLEEWDTFFKVTSDGPVVCDGETETNLTTLATDVTHLKEYVQFLINIVLGIEIPMDEPLAVTIG